MGHVSRGNDFGLDECDNEDVCLITVCPLPSSINFIIAEYCCAGSLLVVV